MANETTPTTTPNDSVTTCACTLSHVFNIDNQNWSKALDLERVLIYFIFTLQLTKYFHLSPRTQSEWELFSLFYRQWNYAYGEGKSKDQNPSQNPLSSACPTRPHGLCQSKRKTRHDYFSALPDSLGLTGEHLLSSSQQLNFVTPENHTWSIISPSLLYLY